MDAHLGCLSSANSYIQDAHRFTPDVLFSPDFFCGNVLHRLIKALIISYNQSVFTMSLREYMAGDKIPITEDYLDELIIKCPTFAPSATYQPLRFRSLIEIPGEVRFRKLTSLVALAAAAHNTTALKELLTQ